MSYSVNVWGSHPEAGNDDCWIGGDYEGLEEAMAAFEDPVRAFAPYVGKDCTHVEIVGVGPGGPVERIRRFQPDPKPEPGNAWKSEYAMQRGMAFGCAGYNDAMGY